VNERLSVVLDATSGNATSTNRVGITVTEASRIKAPISHTIPPAIDRGQAYYWNHAWQLGEQESRAELAAGKGKTFENARDAIRWLLSDDQ